MRNAGVLLPVSSLPSPYGIGDFGLEAKKFISLIKKMGFKSWQVLPLNPLGYGNSPYQPYGSKPLDEIYISLNILYKQGYLDSLPLPFNKESSTVVYDTVRDYKLIYLKKAYKNYFEKSIRGFKIWKNKNSWVYNYAVFVTLKKANNNVQWHYWQEEHKNWINDKKLDLTPFSEEINFQMWLQFVAYTQWNSLHKYAKKHGISLIGDMPIYVGIDSVDVWENPKTFLLDQQYFPTHIAGVPPDYFSETGQRWGNPLYDWDYLEKDDFAFWTDRLGYNLGLFDQIRVDHFRAFDTYWKIPVSCPTAVEGEWVEAPGYQLFNTLLRQFPEMKIIAEDLGDLRPEVLLLRDHFHLPGMEIVQFTYNPDRKYNVSENSNRIIYPGTHDNQTMKGWLYSQDKDYIVRAINDLDQRGHQKYEDVLDKFLALTFASSADSAIFPLQDLLLLGDEARINTPGTIGTPNWEWKLKDFNDLKKRQQIITQMITETNRYRG